MLTKTSFSFFPGAWAREDAGDVEATVSRSIFRFCFTHLKNVSICQRDL